MANVKLQNVHKSYGKTEILKDINLEIEKGQFCVLVGPSGSGKSTILRLIAGFETPTSGDVRLDDKVVNDMSPGDRDLGMVFQNYALFANMSVADNLSFGMKLRKFTKSVISFRMNEIAKMFQIDHYLARLPWQLSGGQRQRVALGRAVMRQTSVILMDEPLSNLDALLRVQTRSEIVRTVKSLGATVVYVTHDQIEALSMADQLVVLKDGMIQQIGTPVEVYQRPANTFVATFFGSPSMNLLPNLQVQAQGDRTVLTNGQLQLNLSGKRRFGESAQFTVGIRPEDLALTAREGWIPIPGTVVHVENLGSEKLAYIEIPNNKMVVRLSPYETVERNSEVTLHLNRERLHYFDSITGIRIDIL